VPSGPQVLEDFGPLARSLGWQLSALGWAREGTRPFISGGVPFKDNDDGRAAENAAAVLFANCLEAAPPC
jgi:hypothetical protein